MGHVQSLIIYLKDLHTQTDDLRQLHVGACSPDERLISSSAQTVPAGEWLNPAFCVLWVKKKKKANTLLARSACTPSADKTCSLQSDTILPSTKRRTPSKNKEPFLFLFFSFSAVLHWGGKKSEIFSNTAWNVEKCLSSCTLQHQYTGVIATLDLHTEFGTLLIYICIWLHNVMAVQ